MIKELVIKNLASSSVIRMKFEVPNICPWCSAKISPEVMSQTGYDTRFGKREDIVSLVLKCPNCFNHFIESYKVSFVNESSVNKIVPIVEKPVPVSTFEYPNEINDISETFGDIINQSRKAEGMGLNHLAGIGYRKAIEFLVKDYLINNKGEDPVKISKETLNNCIKLLDSTKLVSLATAATWIGNDETHYTRRHKSRDIEDMKKFLHSITLFISYELSIEDAEEFTSKN